MELESDVYTNCGSCTCNNHKRLKKGLEGLEIRGRVETIQTTALKRLAKILRRVLEIWEACCHSNCSEKPSVDTGLKTTQRSKIIIVLLLLFTLLEFFTSVLADGFSLESEWQQVSSSLQDSSHDSGCSQQCCRLDSLYPSANFQVLQAF